MGRTAGVVLILLGLLLLVRELRPDFLTWLEPYREAIRNSLGGVTLLAAGSYLLTKRTLRKVVVFLYIVYLLLYLVV
ncbi:hypothetical protein [Thermococcus zilligii]|uniref:hypothetical protein n=1 Tax=Thermococcus zilligii TaxID=54076 RepID=UPI00029B2746|nr:hypothetical protein [Thermococcus zilligii]